MQVIKYFGKVSTYLYLIFLLFITFIIWYFMPNFKKIDSNNCMTHYPLTNTYNNFSKTHQWNVDESLPWKIIETYKEDIEDGIQISKYVQKTNENEKNILVVISPIKNKNRNGYSLGYQNGELNSVKYYSYGKKDGIHFDLHDFYPTLLSVYFDNKSVGVMGFWDYGRIRDIKFGNHYQSLAREDGKNNKVYDNGQTAYAEIVEGDIEYWIIYDINGNRLIKWPFDNDICKAQFFENDKLINVPLYLDQKELEEIFERKL